MSGPSFDDDLPDVPAVTPKPTKGPWKPTVIQSAIAEAGAHIPTRLSDDDIADHFCNAYGNDWRWVAASKTWFHWDNENGWEREETGLIDRSIAEYCRMVVSTWSIAMAATLAQQQKICSVRMQESIKKMCQSDRRVASTPDQWDANDWLLGVPGGVVDLKTGQMRPNEREDHITLRTSVAPDWDRSELWERILEDLHPNRKDIQDFIGRAAGYCLTGSPREEAFFLFSGDGRNGKGLILENIYNIMGQYATMLTEQSVTKQIGQRQSFDIASMEKMRMVFIDEVDRNSTLDEARIKMLTGGADQKAGDKHEKARKFPMTWKVFISCNGKPKMQSGGTSMVARTMLVKFLQSFKGREDKTLKGRLELERAKILGWMIKQCIEWQQEGLNPPADVLEAASDYVGRGDLLGEWLEDATTVGGECKSTDAWHSYKKWIEDRDEEIKGGQAAFRNALDDRGYPYKKTATRRLIMGITLKAIESHPDDRFGDSD